MLSEMNRTEEVLLLSIVQLFQQAEVNLLLPHTIQTEVRHLQDQAVQLIPHLHVRMKAAVHIPVVRAEAVALILADQAVAHLQVEGFHQEAVVEVVRHHQEAVEDKVKFVII